MTTAGLRAHVTSCKAWVGAVLAAAATAGGIYKAHGHITAGDLGVIAGAFSAGWQGVYWTPRERKVNGGHGTGTVS